ncbi:transcription factor C6 [Aspergillus fumigatus]|nr:transcription factor C6 [Aspergillus fumigatus]
MADAIDVGAERPDALAPHPIPVLHVRMRDRSVCILKPRNECRYLKGEPNYADWEMSGDIKEQSPGRRKALTALQSQARAARQGSDHSLPPLSSHSTPSQPTPFSNASESTPPNRDDWWYNGTDNLFLNRSGEHHYVGPAAAVALAKRLHPSPSNLAWDVRPLYDDPLSLHRSVNRTLPQLPPYEFAKRLFWVQYAYIGTIFSLLQPEDFEERLNAVYHHPPDFSNRESCLVYCQVLLVIAYGLMYSVNQWSGDDGPPGFKYFKHALRFLPDIHEEGSIFFVEVLCYVAYYMQNLNRRDAAFLYIGLALRMAISLGLHQEVSHPDVSDADRYRRRRAWWSVYSLDRLLSVKSGNPITIQDEDIGTLWPIPEGGAVSAPWPSVVLTHYTQLSRILEIYRKKPRSGSNLLASVQSITNDLSDWLRQVPDRLRIDFTTLDTHINRESVSIFLHFYSCINMTARPLVFYVIQRRLDAETGGPTANDWKEGLSQNTVAVIESCITAARATTLIMDAAARHNLVATYGYLDGEYIFSAALLLVMVNAAFPHNETNARTMDMALNLLRSMADRGNTYLGSRHSLLLELQASIGSNQVAQGRVDFNAPVTPISTQQRSPPQTIGIGEDARVGHSDWPSQQHITFNLDINDDPGLWEEVLGQIDIDMDTDWIENTLRKQD